MKIGKSKLTRELLESYAGKDVRITLNTISPTEPPATVFAS